MQRFWFRRRYRWLIPALFALVIFIGSLTGNLITSGMDDFVERNRLWLWIITGLAGLAAVAVAAWDARHPEESAIKPGLGEIDRHKALTSRYLSRMVVERVQHLPLRGVDFKTASAETGEQERLGMADVYIALDTTSREPQEMGAATRREEERALSALKALVLHQQLVLLGGPGSGKSTFLNHLAYCLAMEALDPKGDWLARLPEWPQEWRDLLPVPITLREVAAWFQETQPPQRQAGLFQTYLAYRLAQAGVDDGFDLVCEHLRMGRAILLLDGLDEIPLQDDTLSRIKEMISDLPNAYEKTPILVTCRVLSYEDKRWQLAQKEWPTVELAMLDEEKIDRFIRAWYTQLARMAVVSDAADQITRLSQAVRRPDLWRLAGNPLLLTVMAHVHTHKGELPDTRTLLYEYVVDLLLWRWEAINKSPQPDGRETRWRRLLQAAELTDMDMKQALWELAYQVHSQNQAQGDEEIEATADITESQLLATLRKLHPERSLDWAETLVQLMVGRAGLLVEGRPQVYSFPHRTFQEYLAGSHLSSLPDFTTQALTLAQSGAYWREAILLAVGRLVHVVGAIEPPLVFVDELCPASGPVIQGDEAWRNVWLAGECLLEVGLTRAGRRKLGEELVERVPLRLATLISHGHLSPRERAHAGSVLGTIGDPRNLDEMVPVPAGEFLMGSDKSRDKDAYDDELPQHSLFVDSFRISKYPVTNGQYARFVAATGHPAPGHWKGTTPPPELTNHPVVNLSWHDAVAYCGWLGKLRGETVRLPTEAEWEKAARGPDGRVYPWGDNFDSDRLNMAETGIGTTSPVGMFHWGSSPYRCLDMAGNVWEWTQSLWGKDVQKPEFGYPYDPNDGREDIDAPDSVRRVLRGGSFGSDRLGVRCASRARRNPDYRDLSSGFRVMSPGL